MAERLKKVKLLLGISQNDKDSILQLLIQYADEFAKDYTKRLSVPDSLILDLVAFRYNQIGNEGLQSESYSGLSFSYEGLPENLKAHLNHLRKVVFL